MLAALNVCVPSDAAQTKQNHMLQGLVRLEQAWEGRSAWLCKHDMLLAVSSDGLHKAVTAHIGQF